ncbi:MAG: 1-(5-phosphoribosyl)-5-[(5-phosphoribosylamino)methylideneamino]imidazole-4-carboxamide isomerase [Saprospiraceae bacterium]|uniref:1-(5-phosphoribosyl)-5-[(5-phosphoribosylamino)methylideneamino] imidazole-4-carboxamide isomerase n=1 Tax=Candidatus Opimibacter skivensis TaxID=2982028 RepID=A0A9D7SS48_9BACT|nr:1-(5-phosphoribosyl)-5-[(5-phosphoribosylamino)methylideneamino]imidazole-4-carboxamide isomerase [Candidatus Opimibacter skivensis]
MRIIPTIDILDGKCVRLTKGDYSTQIIYNENPLEVAKMFEDAGMKYLHVVDLDGAKAKRMVNYRTLEKLVSNTNLNIDIGGGIKSEEDVKIAFEWGAKQITVGSIAVQNPVLMLEWIKKYGADKIILGADCKERKIATHGWQENSNIDVISFIQDYARNGAKYSIVTDIDKDGMLSGPSFNLYKEILSKTTITLIASGGITTIEDVKQLKEMRCEGAIIGKAIYEGTVNLKELSALC